MKSKGFYVTKVVVINDIYNRAHNMAGILCYTSKQGFHPSRRYFTMCIQKYQDLPGCNFGSF
uniref:Uncharacterized protein n=1 Tax=Lepeophtheirus salmonis TaxID=72036 RepID=A0A0K2VIB1_LEPSM